MPDLRCAECHYSGIAGISVYEREHRVRHDEHLHGARLRRIERFEWVGHIEAIQVLLVRPDADLFARRRAERVSRRAIREAEEGGYDKLTFYADSVYQIVPEMHSHALILSHEGRGVGLLVVERRDREFWYQWTDEGYVLTPLESAGGAWCIAHIWLLPSFRRLGLASRLLELAFRGFAVNPSEAGWVTPFTSNGNELVRQFSPSGFWRAGYTPPAPDLFSRRF